MGRSFSVHSARVSNISNDTRLFGMRIRLSSAIRCSIRPVLPSLGNWCTDRKCACALRAFHNTRNASGCLPHSPKAFKQPPLHIWPRAHVLLITTKPRANSSPTPTPVHSARLAPLRSASLIPICYRPTCCALCPTRDRCGDQRTTFSPPRGPRGRC